MRAHVIRFGLLAVLLALAAPGAALAQEPATPPSADGMNEGVAVHGHWTITVVREGEVVERREFENALVITGTRLLAELLSRTMTAGPWAVVVEADGSGALCADNDVVFGDDTDCTISEKTAELSVSVDVSDPTNQKVVLLGSETVQRDGNLVFVNTGQELCSADVTPNNCLNGVSLLQFTRAGVEPVIPVQDGDQIEVTVEISFN